MVIKDLFGDRARNSIGEKRRLVGLGMYPMDLVASVLFDLSFESGGGIDRRSVEVAINKRERKDGLKDLRVGQETFCGRPLNFIEFDGLLQLVGYYHHEGKIKSYTEAGVRSALESRVRSYLSGSL